MPDRVPAWVWPLIVIAAYFAVMLLAFRLPFFTEHLWGTLRSPKWWAENGLSFVFFGLFVGWVASLFQKIRADRAREPFENWMLHVTGISAQPQRIYWRDIEAFFHSEFEQWKFVKSAVSNYAIIKTPDLATAKKNKWLKAPDWKPQKAPLPLAERRITISLEEMTEADIAKWHLGRGDDTPGNWEWVELNRPEEKDTFWKLQHQIRQPRAGKGHNPPDDRRP